MKASSFWKSDWFIGLAIGVLVVLMSGSELLQGLERKAYDMGVRFSSAQPSDQVAVIAIDDQSIANIGRWPWPRDVHARLTDILAQSKARVVGNTVFFTEPQFDPSKNFSHANILKLGELVASPVLKALPGPAAAEIEAIQSLVTATEASLNTDRQLARSVRGSGNVMLGMLFQQIDREPIGNPDKPLPDYVVRNTVAAAGNAVDTADLPLSGLLPIIPFAEIGAGAAGIGHLNNQLDIDGAVRSDALVVRHYDQYFPSLALLLAAKSLNLAPKDIQVEYGTGVRLGRLSIRTDARMLMQTFWYRGSEGRPAFAPDSFYDVLTGRIPASKYRDKIVIIGPTAAGVGSILVTPIATDMPGVMALAHSVSSILQEHFFVTPWWGSWARWGAVLLVLLYLALALPRMTAGLAAGVTAALFVLVLAVHFGLMSAKFTWVPLMLPLVLLVVGHLALTTKRFLVTERGKERSDVDLAHTNRMLGLGYQGQGQLDMAFDCFRKLPVDDSVLELLYNLGLDYERKRQFNKAESVFKYMADFNRKFRDIGERAKRAVQMSNTVIMGSGASQHPGGSLILGAGAEKPKLGRFEVEKELGKGAMGVVYLGRDPKIGRVVAIKTMALSQEFEGDELADVKERFFREAQTAGRLAHPNIVTIYDTGEEHDLAYIAMEFLKGKDLVAHTKPDALLPLKTVVGIVARVAEALSYAHANNVVHRDVKPANIMYEPTTDSVKVTDFGIARITDSSRTKTGMVLGTPSYMSPEQLSGQKIDGKSDLFSLGVMLYQLTCGQLPFKGESMAQLMFRIANEAPVPIQSIRPDAPACLVSVLDVALSKQPARRFQTGDEMAAALRECLKALP
ncbi:MAG: CHASE2 domain-containing protein [Betaproteobacteria bacterium]|jgi:serine/threonine-protein kinase|nr:CHASE2 domain-containing protein [Betaproteobacteria bacterium]